MRGGAPQFEWNDGVRRRETRAELIPRARRTPCTLSARRRAPTKGHGREPTHASWKSGPCARLS